MGAVQLAKARPSLVQLAHASSSSAAHIACRWVGRAGIRMQAWINCVWSRRQHVSELPSLCVPQTSTPACTLAHRSRCSPACPAAGAGSHPRHPSHHTSTARWRWPRRQRRKTAAWRAAALASGTEPPAPGQQQGGAGRRGQRRAAAPRSSRPPNRARTTLVSGAHSAFHASQPCAAAGAGRAGRGVLVEQAGGSAAAAQRQMPLRQCHVSIHDPTQTLLALSGPTHLHLGHFYAHVSHEAGQGAIGAGRTAGAGGVVGGVKQRLHIRASGQGGKASISGWPCYTGVLAGAAGAGKVAPRPAGCWQMYGSRKPGGDAYRRRGPSPHALPPAGAPCTRPTACMPT